MGTNSTDRDDKDNKNTIDKKNIVALKIMIVIVCLLLAGAMCLLVLEIKSYIDVIKTTDSEETEFETVSEEAVTDIVYKEDESEDINTENTISANDASEDNDINDIEDNLLTSWEDYYPDNIRIGEPLPETLLTGSDGISQNLKERYKGENIVIMFWGSWCPYCDEQLKSAHEFEEVISKYEDTELVLINKTDTRKNENEIKANAYLKEKGINFDNYFDRNLEIYNAYGVHLIPTTIIVDKEGVVRYINIDGISSGSQLDDVLYTSLFGWETATQIFIENCLALDNGLIACNVNSNWSGIHPSGRDSLSESQGLMMRYALIKEDTAMFDGYYQAQLLMKNNNGLYSWYRAENGENAMANAFLDDIRILHMLKLANDKWGGYDQDIQELSEALLSKNSKGNQIYSFYDFKMKMPGNSISLCYADFQAFKDLSEIDSRWADIYDNLLLIVTNGFISSEFPLYYSSYTYSSGQYGSNNLNISEALIVLYHLAVIGEIKEESITWLKSQLENDTLYSAYQCDGKVVSGFEYDSTAAYGIAGLIGIAASDEELVSLAVEKMNRTRISDRNSTLYGAFSKKNNESDIVAFDQIIPLIVYASENN